MALPLTLPELGENIESGTVTRVLVTVGQTVAKDQPVIELETDKAVVEVPSPMDGTVSEIRASEGATLYVGDVILMIEGEAPPKAEEKPQKKTPTVDPVAQAPPKKEEPAEEPDTPPPAKRRGTVAASPAVRRLAREIGIDIDEVTPSAATGRISADDVKAHAREANTTPRGPAATVPLPDFTQWGEVERQSMTNVRRLTATRMAASWATIPHVTHHDKADITEIERLRKEYGAAVAEKGGKLTATAILVKVLATALKKFPQFNASVDMESHELILKRYYNIGVAVDTDRGLIVPVLKNVDRKNIVQITAEITGLAERAREHKSTLDELQGGTCTVTNLGGIGGTAFSPIINAPEVAVLGVSRARVEAVFQDGAFAPRPLMPLCVSYDHRAIDGADAARFLRWICRALEEPFLLQLEG